ncbi:MAG: outer membrane protein assembly factor BamE [Bacteroidaceae bacterium]|nr:outer membrane protein assembly factor BamE [Bacteroidaceae bacterium]
MKKIYRLMTVAVVATMLVGCASLSGLFRNSLMDVELGMTKDQVIQLLGQPSFRTLNDEYEELGFTQNYSMNDYIITIINVQFVDGKVVALDSYPMPKKPEIKAVSAD